MRRTTASTDEKRHAACRTRPQTGVIQRALEYAMGIHDHRRWRLRRVLVGHAQIWLWAFADPSRRGHIFFSPLHDFVGLLRSCI